MLTNTPELTEALNEFRRKMMKDMFNKDKAYTIPDIKSAKILPIWYDSIYGEQDV